MKNEQNDTEVLKENALSLMTKGDELNEQGELREAFRFFEDAREISRRIRDFSVEARLLNRIGKISEKKGDFKNAIGRYEEALRLFGETGEPEGEVDALNNLAKVYRLIGNVQVALEFYEQSLAILEKLDRSEQAGFAIVFCNIASIYEEEQKIDRALSYYEQSLAALKEGKNQEVRSRIISTMTAFIVRNSKECDMAQISRTWYLTDILSELLTGSKSGDFESLLSLKTLALSLGKNNYKAAASRLPKDIVSLVTIDTIFLEHDQKEKKHLITGLDDECP